MAGSLKKYREKRDFEKTAEPPPKAGVSDKERRIFVVQKHSATRLHYDFRLEVEGVLKSWAIPKGPSLDPAEKRLAMRTEDHPIEYAAFEGVIPEGQYGAGEVIVWDAGRYKNMAKDKKGCEIPMGTAIEKGNVKIWLNGKKLHGNFALVRTKTDDAKKEAWLLIKKKDSKADPSRDIVKELPKSVLSGKTIEQMAERPEKVWSNSR